MATNYLFIRQKVVPLRAKKGGVAPYVNYSDINNK